MKTAKKLTALLLCIAMLLGIGATSAFAANVGDEIKWTVSYWDDYEYVNHYTLAGTLNEGENTVTGTSEYWDFVVCEFEAAQAGYYYFTSDYWNDIAEQYQNGVAKDFADREEMYFEISEDEGIYGDVYYLPAGTSLIRVETYNYDETTVNIEYLGDVAEIKFDEADLEDRILGNDVYLIEEENTLEAENCNYSVTFSNGKTLDSDNWYTVFETNSTIVKGDNTLAFDFLGYETEVTMGIYEITDFVESIELQKHEDHLNAKYYYDGTIEHFDLGDKPEYVIVNFTDGTSGTFEYYYGPSYTNNTITLPNGKEVYVYAYLDYNEEGQICFVAGMADHHFIEEPCYIESASFAENFDHLSENISYCINSGVEYFSWSVRELIYDIVNGNFYWIMYDIQNIFNSYYLTSIFSEISMFISNCF